MNIRLLGDRVLVEVDNGEKKTSSGLIVPNSSNSSDIRFGKVVATGPGKVTDYGHFNPMHVVMGDNVSFQYGNFFSLEGKNYILINEGDVIGII